MNYSTLFQVLLRGVRDIDNDQMDDSVSNQAKQDMKLIFILEDTHEQIS